MNILDKIKHFFGIHKYYKIRRLSDYSHLLGCELCEKRFSMNTSMKVLLDWDQELEDFHRYMGHLETDYKGK